MVGDFVSVDQRNIEVDLDVWKKLKGEAIKRNKNLRQFVGEILSDFIKTPKDNPKTLKAIIIAAGMSTRLRPLTDDKPKCMLEIAGKTIIQRQIEIFRSCGIDDIIVIRGYKKEKINYSGVKYVHNLNYRKNNILGSLMCAEHEMNSDVIITYSDILFEKHVVEKLMKSKADVSVIVDKDWIKSYEGRSQHPVEEAENVVMSNGNVVKIGKILNPNDAHGEFIGLLKLTKNGTGILKNEYGKLKISLGNDEPFQTASTFEKAYLTDMFQYMIDKGITVTPVIISSSWKELDTVEDFKNAEKLIMDKKAFNL
jgi:L-glutamine-phosphate cytidylyltransferase